MKVGAIVRIIIWLLVAAILTGLLVSILVFKEVRLFGGSGIWGYQYDNADRYTVGDGVVPGSVNQLDIHWIAGSVTIRPYDGKQVKLEETGVQNDDGRLRYRVENGKLTVQYQKSGWTFGFWNKTGKKDLVVSVPSEMAKNLITVEISSVSAEATVKDIVVERKVKMEAVSGGLTLENVTAGACELENVSGKTELENVSIEELEIETVSGYVYGNGAIGSLDCEGVSANVKITTRERLKRMKVETVSGDVEVCIPENDGFTVKIQKVSGGFTSDFAVKAAGKTYTYGDGSADYSMETVSGNLRILKSE